MNAYYCIVNDPGAPVREIAVLKASDDASATMEAQRLASRWPGFETVEVYHCERRVAAIANPDDGVIGALLEIEPLAA